MASQNETVTADEIFKEFKEHSISEFFRKNSQMLGYSGKVRSLTTVVHEYVTNSLDACEEANILPSISVEIKETGEERYSVFVSDNGPGIPKTHMSKALASILTGTKFHRSIQQRGQQGIGASGCTLFSEITTGKPIHVVSRTGKDAFECDVTIDIKGNKSIVTNMTNIPPGQRGLAVRGEFAEIKYENSDHGVLEYLKRTALSNPHAELKLIEPDGNVVVFPRSTDMMPKKPKLIKPHPLGLGTNDLLDYARVSQSRKISSFLVDTFSRVTHDKVNEVKEIAKDVDFGKEPRHMTWDDAEKITKAFKQVKWMSPDMDALSTIGEKQIELAMKNILNPEFMSVIERKPKVYHGGVPFVVEVGIAYGGNAGKQNAGGVSGNILRYANKVPLLFDAGGCAITEAVNTIEWKRYAINMEEEPVSVFVNLSSVYVFYGGVGKQAVAQDDELIEEIRLATMDAARRLERHISNKKNMHLQESRYKTIMRYVSQLSADLEEITGKKHTETEKELKDLIEKKYKSIIADEGEPSEEKPAESADAENE